MTATGSIDERLRSARLESFVGRERELDVLARCLDEDGPAVTFVHGVGGIGKSALLGAFETRLLQRGVRVLKLDGRGVEPTPRGLLAALGTELRAELASVPAAAAALSALPGTTVLAIDHYELLRLVDSWVRRELVPALPSSARVLLAGRSAPVGAWVSWQALIRTLRLAPLDEAAAQRLLEQLRVPASDIPRIQRFAQGHPLALELAAAAALERPELPLAQLESRRVVEELVRVYLEDVREPETRATLEAASVVRRATRPLLVAMLGKEAGERAVERLRELSFVEQAPDGLAVDRSVRQALDEALRALDPERHHELRRAAWECLRRELPALGRAQSWRYIADILFLLEHASIREAFFPSGDHLFAIEHALPEDADAIVSITERFDSPAGARALEAWWRHAPDAFHVARDRDGRVCAYYLLAWAAQLDDGICAQDPVAARWRLHLTTTGIPLGDQVLLSRRMLARDSGEAPSDVRAACWLDIKRTYLENPSARRLYLATAEPRFSYPALSQLGFEWLRPLSIPALARDARSVETFTLDFGPRGISGWIERLLDAQLARAAPHPPRAADPNGSAPSDSATMDPGSDGGAPAQPCAVAPCRLDLDARELVVEEARVRLTPREFGLLRYLCEHPGRVVERDELLREVWQQPFGGSNVVDAAVRSLRRKLGDYATSIETIVGFGYRFNGFRAAPAAPGEHGA